MILVILGLATFAFGGPWGQVLRNSIDQADNCQELTRRERMMQCKWCGASTSIGKGPVAKPEWSRWRCSNCGMFGYVNEPDSGQLSQVYTSAWQDSNDSGTYAAGSTDEKIAQSLLSAVDFSPASVKCLDYGGGKGNFAKALVNKGVQDLTVFEPFGENPGIDSIRWASDMNDIEGEKFDWIFMIEVIEHLLDPQQELNKVRQFLSPGGKLVITTPNARGWRARIDGFNWREAQNPTHINLFSAARLKICLTNAGFSNVQRILRPVAYRATGARVLALALTQMMGIDGGLRFVAINGSVL